MDYQCVLNLEHNYRVTINSFASTSLKLFSVRKTVINLEKSALLPNVANKYTSLTYYSERNSVKISDKLAPQSCNLGERYF